MSQMGSLTHTMKEMARTYDWSKGDFVKWFDAILGDLEWDFTYETRSEDFTNTGEYFKAKELEQKKLLEEIWENP